MENYNNVVKSRIKAIRLLHALSQREIALKMKYNMHTYKNLERNIETGGIVVTLEHVRDLCAAYEFEDTNYFAYGAKLDRHLPEFYFDK